MDKEDMVHVIYTTEYYSTFKESEILPFAAIWMEMKIIILSEMSQTEKEKKFLRKDVFDTKET